MRVEPDEEIREENHNLLEEVQPVWTRQSCVGAD